MWTTKHCSILFSSILQQPDRFLPCRLFHLHYKYLWYYFLTVFILTHPINFPWWRKPEHPEKTHDFGQSVDWHFSHESVARIQPTISDVKDACSDDCDTEAPPPPPIKFINTSLEKHKEIMCIPYGIIHSSSFIIWFKNTLKIIQFIFLLP
jgi:hypothetical protein